MSQPIRKKAVKKSVPVPHIQGTGAGLDYCNDCPFLDLANGFCNTSDRKLYFKNRDKIKVPDWCGNHRKEK